MHKRLKAVVAPTVVVAAISLTGYARAQGPDSSPERLDELGAKRPAAASHRAVDGALAAAGQAADVKRWNEAVIFNEAVKAHQLQLYFQAVAANEAEQAAQAAQAAKARTPKPVAQTGRVGGGGGSSVGGACGGASNGADAYIGRESGGNPNARNSSGAWGCYQIMPGTWSSSCSDLGQHGSASTQAQAACASRLPQSAWSSSG